MNDGTNARQQIVEKIKDSANILVTVGTDPSVDELSAALGLTMLLNKQSKHATAVVSGAIPPAITFLDPEKTFENSVDSLRDFIIALDKEKADHLRYKVEGDVVKIFITPYRTTISDADLDFSQGDYNVELVLALGVENEEHLDQALESHGRILHDATVATISNKSASKLGSIDWFDDKSSSICEMLVALSEALKGDKPLLDEQISTAFLTGIVASTDRFSNDRTSSKVMTMAAQLMAAGANQQLIAAKLQDAREITGDTPDKDSSNSDGTTSLSENTSTKLEKDDPNTEDAPAKDSNDGALAISHQPEDNLDEVARQVSDASAKTATTEAEDALAQELETVAPAANSAKPSLDDLKGDIAKASGDVDAAASAAPTAGLDSVPTDYEPTMGGTLNATTEQAADQTRRDIENDRNKTILSHSHSTQGLDTKDGPTFATAPFSASTGSGESSTAPQESLQSKTGSLPPLPQFDIPVASTSSASEPTGQTLAELDKANRVPHDDALAAVHAVFDDPANPAPSTPPATESNLSSSDQLPPLPSTPASVDSIPVVPTSTSGLPPLPDFSTLPPEPGVPSSPASSAPFAAPSTDELDRLGKIFDGSHGSTTIPSDQPPSNDPGQFKIPGQS